MVRHLTPQLIKRIHNKSIGENEDGVCERPDDVKFSIDFVKEYLQEYDLYRQALGYCISLIVLHPFNDANHRTSLYSAIIFLMINLDIHRPSVESVKKIQKWRTNEIDKNDYEMKREFFNITCIEHNDSLRKQEIKRIMESHYGIIIEQWLRNNCKKNSNVL